MSTKFFSASTPTLQTQRPQETQNTPLPLHNSHENKRSVSSWIVACEQALCLGWGKKKGIFLTFPQTESLFTG